MEDMRSGKNNVINTTKWNLKKIKRRHIIYGAIIIIALTILFFPEQSGRAIGNWINDFFMTIINIVKHG